jgi:hypothetical protein
MSKASTFRPWRASHTLLRPSPSATLSQRPPGFSRGACVASQALGAAPNSRLSAASV